MGQMRPIICLLLTTCAVSLHAQPATQPEGELVSPDAQKLLDSVRAAYQSLNSIEVAGTYKLEFEAAGQRQDHEARFSGVFVAPNRLRHEMQNDSLLVSTGETIYLFIPQLSKYTEAEAPGGRFDVDELPGPHAAVLREQNPSLLLAFSKDPSAALIEGAASVDVADDVVLDGVNCNVIIITSEESDRQLLIDPQTKLIRQVRIDLRKSLQKQQVPMVNTARITIDYTKSLTDPNVADDAFAWTPPADATLARANPVAIAQAEPEQLKGKRAPEFKLKSLEDKTVSLAGMKGSVVVLDFWASWCGPCRAAMPLLQKLQEDFAEQGVKVVAVNVKEDANTARGFIENNKLTLTTLLDRDGKVAADYGVNGIPQTVVIGKNGVIRNVFIGFGSGSEQILRKAIEEALAGE